MKDLSIQALSALVTQRSVSLFRHDLDSFNAVLKDRLNGSRVLVIGGAGSIGSATIGTLAEFGPAALHVVDHNENELAELIRCLRNSSKDLSSTDLRTFPLDFGSPLMYRFLSQMAPYDHVLNFAALKHVRSEKDVYSLLRMFEVNLVKALRFLEWLSEGQRVYRYFCVSTDKAANPVNLMGASKYLMERLIFSDEVQGSPSRTATSARFANVAFSKGSLLESFLIRLSRHEPIAVPRQTRRYFISSEESGQICALAAFCAPDGHLLIPALDEDVGLIELEEIARIVLRAHGLKPRFYEDELVSKQNVGRDMGGGYYPVLLTPLDTSGEKAYEEFVGEGELTIDVGMDNLRAINPGRAPADRVISFVRRIEELVSNPQMVTSKTAIVEMVQDLIPGFRHIETGKSLDGRM